MDLGIRGLGPGVRIGLGASAAVYRARQEQLGRDVAVKLLTERDPSFVRRFEREALALGQLSRLPGILTVHDTGLTEQGEPYLVLQYCPSSLLDRLHREGPLPPGEAARLIARVAVTVAGAHEAGIVHRDLKPANILLTHEGEPLVADLGMASVLGAGITTSIGFTPGYAAPENLRGEPGGPDVDVYALGASLFQLVTGRVPFTDPSGLNNLVALAVAIDSQPVEDLRPLGVPDGLCRVIEAAMTKDPARRPTAAALAEQLEAVAAAGPPRSGPVDVGPAGGRSPIEVRASPRPGVADPAPPLGAAPHPWAPAPGPPVLADRSEPLPPPNPAGRWQPAPEPRRRPAAVAAWGGAGLVGLMVALLLAWLPGGGGPSGDFVTPATTTATSAFFTTTTGPPPVSSRPPATAWTPSRDLTIADLGTYEQTWAQARAEAVAALAAPGVLEAYRPTTAGCPDGWSDTSGISDGKVTVELRVPDSSLPEAEAVRAGKGLAAYFDWVNANGGIGPDRLQVVAPIADGEGSAPAGSPEPFAVAALSDSTHQAVADDAISRCVPEPLATTPHPAAGDLDSLPWTTPGPVLGLRTEAYLWVELIDRRLGLDRPPSIVVLASADEAGALYRQAFDDALAARSFRGAIAYIADISELSFPPEALVVMGSPDACTELASAADPASGFVPVRILSSTCAATHPAGGAGLDGWLMLRGGARDATTYPYEDDAFQQLITDELTAAGLDPSDEAIRRGFGLHGWLWHQTMEVAAALPGGLTRTNLLAAQRSLSGLSHPMLLTGVTLATGPGDQWLVDGSDVSRWDAASHRWVIDEVIDLNGTVPGCRWRAPTLRCGPV